MLSSFFQRLRQRASASVADASPLSSADIEVARVRARRRLVGMVVLVGAGVIGLPWLFETQPRPLPSDVQVVSAVSSRATGLPASGSRAPSIAAVTVPEAPPGNAPDSETVEEAPEPAKPQQARSASAPASKPSPARTSASQAAAAKPARPTPTPPTAR
ncbi:MAG: hypothetical protein EOP38_22700, partial [Rubrivivax sp.]